MASSNVVRSGRWCLPVVPTGDLSCVSRVAFAFAFAARTLEIGVSALRALEARPAAPAPRAATRRVARPRASPRSRRCRIATSSPRRSRRGASRRPTRASRRPSRETAGLGARAPRVSEGDRARMRHREEARARRFATRAPDSTSEVRDRCPSGPFSFIGPVACCVTKPGKQSSSRKLKKSSSTDRTPWRDPQSEPRFSPTRPVRGTTRRHAVRRRDLAPRGAFPGSLAPREPSSRESFGLARSDGAFHAAVPRTRRGRGPPADSHEALARPRGATRRHRALPVRVAPRLLCSHPARPRTPTDRTSSQNASRPNRNRPSSSSSVVPVARNRSHAFLLLFPATSAPPSKAAPPRPPKVKTLILGGAFGVTLGDELKARGDDRDRTVMDPDGARARTRPCFRSARTAPRRSIGGWRRSRDAKRRAT